jgi:hypothetical protein
VLVGLRFAPDVQIGVIGHPTVSLTNDTSAAVVVKRCARTCSQPDAPVPLAPGRSLRLEPGSAAEWLIEDGTGNRLGCVAPASSPLYVSRAAPCRS